MAGFFSRKKKEDAVNGRSSKAKKGTVPAPLQPSKPKWEDAWARKSVDPEEVQELLRGCTLELKSKALDMPFLLLPFRPTSDSVAARTFIRNFFDRAHHMHGEQLAQELRLTEPMVLCSVVKWCWARLPGGVVGWEAYELFRVGEADSNMARDSFATFIPLSVESDARTSIIFDFFDLLSAVAAHGKKNGLGGRKLSRLAGWWAFEHAESGSGFDGGYKKWEAAADATSHLFFAYLRSLAPESFGGVNGISTLPMSLQKLVAETEYPPEQPTLLFTRTLKVAMIVETVSPTPFALLRRTNQFEYRDEDRALQDFSSYEDPVQALSDECRRVLKSISAANQSSHMQSPKQAADVPDATWSRFEDIGFSASFSPEDDEEPKFGKKKPLGLRGTAASGMDMGRPTTPSWADFMSSGFGDEAENNPSPLLLPPSVSLPPIDTTTRGRSSHSHAPRLESDQQLEPGELASITRFDLDEAFWWVWISSLAGEEPSDRKAAFGRCALVETVIPGGKWLVMEEIIKGAGPEISEDAYIAEKKGFFSWTRRGKHSTRRGSTGKHDRKANGHFRMTENVGVSKTSIGPDQHARIQAAAAQLTQKQRDQESTNVRRGRVDVEASSMKTNSVLTLQPVIMKEASPAMKWAHKYDKDAIREAYLANNAAGKGLGTNPNLALANGNGHVEHPVVSTMSPQQEEVKPAVPAKPAAPISTVTPAVAAAQRAFAASQSQPTKVEKAEAPLPAEAQLMERKPVPLPHHPSVTNLEAEQGQDRNTSMDGDQSYDKHNKLQKKITNGDKSGGGFRKMFGRKKSNAQEPTNGFAAKARQGQGQSQLGGATLGRRFSGFRKKSPNPVESSRSVGVTSPPPIQEDEYTPVASPEPQRHSYAPSTHDSLSRVDTNDAHEANQEFSRFDQGPLDDQPAFDGTHEDSLRQSEDHDYGRETHEELDFNRGPVIPQADELDVEEAPKTSPVTDRWAQIRKNAAERAAQRQSEEQSHGGQSAATDGDGETSGEETIESRVARIKARVAELTGHMETGGPSPPNGRRS